MRPHSGAPVQKQSCVFAVVLLVLAGCSNAAHGPEASSPRSQTAARAPATKTLVLEVLPARERVTESAVLDALKSELKRAFQELGRLPEAPYFLSYQVTDTLQEVVSASYGGILESRREHDRLLDVDLRLGSPKRDNTHALSGDEGMSSFRGRVELPLQDNGRAFRNAVWVATNREYELARQDLMRVQSDIELKAAAPPPGDDFTEEAPFVYVEATSETPFDRAAWEERLTRVSAIAAGYPELLETSVALLSQTQSRHFASSAGARVQLGRRHARVSFSAETLTRDGMRLQLFDSIDSASPGKLPADAVLEARFEKLLVNLAALSKAPLVEPYVGPAILDGRAAGVFFHEVLGHRLEGHRQDAKAEGQTFAKMVGQRVIPARISVYDDPRISKLNGVELNGYYAYDDEGVPAQQALLVEDGVLRGFLLSRAPTRGFIHSNGHGRREAGHRVVARQANLVVDPIEPVTPEDLKAALLNEVKRQKLAYGLRFTEISGGYTQTQRFDTQAFKVIPVMVYRVYPDGREELVRGVDIEGTPLLALSKIVAAGNDFEVFNGVCGAESGWVPVSATSPSLLLSQIEVARQEQLDLLPPIMPPPAKQDLAQ